MNGLRRRWAGFSALIHERKVGGRVRGKLHQPDPEQARFIRVELARRLEARSEVVAAFLHGSFARGEAFHDIDVAVVVDPAQVPEADALAYMAGLGAELEWELNLPMDVRVINWSSPDLRFAAAQGEVLVSRGEAAADFLEHAALVYLDLEPFYRQQLSEWMGRAGGLPG